MFYLRDAVHELKPGAIRKNHGNVTNLSKLKQIMALGLLEPMVETMRVSQLHGTVHLIVLDDNFRLVSSLTKEL